METTLLTYYFPSQPYPLEVSTNNHFANGSLTVVVSDPAGDVYAQGIDIYLPIGAGQPGYLSGNTPIASCNTTRWTIGSGALVKEEDLPLVLRVGGRDGATPYYVMYACIPETNADELIDFDLQFTFQITGVDTFTGPYVVGIGETASKTAGVFGNMVFASYTAIKTQAAFTLKNFIASATTGDVNAPIGSIARNTAFQLSWESNGSQFRLYTAQNPTPIYTGTSSAYTVAGGITTDTTYILQATLANDSSAGPSFESSVLYDTLTVTCSNADLVTNSIQNATTINSTGDITTQGNITAHKNATFQGMTVNGASTLSSLRVNSTLTVEATSTFSTTTANIANATTLNAANLNVTGPLIAQASTVQMFAPSVILWQSFGNTSEKRSFIANTDGMVLGFANTLAMQDFMLNLAIAITPANPQALPYQSGASLTTDITLANVLAPVSNGDTIQLGAFQQGNFTEDLPLFTFYFIGLGGTSSFTPIANA